MFTDNFLAAEQWFFIFLFLLFLWFYDRLIFYNTIFLLDLLQLFIKGISSVWFFLFYEFLWVCLALELWLWLWAVFPSFYFLVWDYVVLLALVVEVLSVCFCALEAVVHWFVVFHHLFVSSVWIVWLWFLSLWRVVWIWVGNCLVLVFTFTVVFLEIAFLFLLRSILWVLWEFWFCLFLAWVFLYSAETCLLLFYWFGHYDCMVFFFSWGFVWLFFWLFCLFFDSWMTLFWLLFLLHIADSAVILGELVFKGLFFFFWLLPWQTFAYFSELIWIWLFPFFLFSQESDRFMKLVFSYPCWCLSFLPIFTILPSIHLFSFTFITIATLSFLFSVRMCLQISVLALSTFRIFWFWRVFSWMFGDFAAVVVMRNSSGGMMSLKLMFVFWRI